MSTSRVDVGTPPENFKGWIRTEVCIHGFANLPTMRDEAVLSPQFSLLGHKWRLWIYPGGTNDSVEGCVVIYLGNCSDTSIKISYGFSVRDATGKEVVHFDPQTEEFAALDSDEGEGNNARGANLAKRPVLIDSLVDGSLVIEVRIKSTTADNKSITQFIPTNPLYKKMFCKSLWRKRQM